MGVIGPDNKLPKRRAYVDRTALQSSLYDTEDDSWTDSVKGTSAMFDDQKQWRTPAEQSTDMSEALSLFPDPKTLLNRVVQVATSSNRLKVTFVHWTVNSMHLL